MKLRKKCNKKNTKKRSNNKKRIKFDINLN